MTALAWKRICSTKLRRSSNKRVSQASQSFTGFLHFLKVQTDKQFKKILDNKRRRLHDLLGKIFTSKIERVVCTALLKERFRDMANLRPSVFALIKITEKRLNKIFGKGIRPKAFGFGSIFRFLLPR